MKIKIRFLEKYKCWNGILLYYYIQKKTIFGWKYISFVHNLGYGYGSIKYNYYDEEKTILLKKVLEEHYKNCDKFITIHEYPSLKIYN